MLELFSESPAFFVGVVFAFALVIGSFLTAEERHDLATALRRALRRARCHPAPV